MAFVAPVEEGGWKFKKHITGSAYHKPQGYSSWIDFWKHHVGVENPPCLCPGHRIQNVDDPERIDAHEMKKNEPKVVNTVGSHVLLEKIEADGTKRREYAIIPTCNRCNPSKPDSQDVVLFYCKAVTIIDFNSFDHRFVGKITLPRATDWWHYITKCILHRDEQGDIANVSIEGWTNRNTRPEAISPEATRWLADHARQHLDGGDEVEFENDVCTATKHNVTCNRRRCVYEAPPGYLGLIAQLWQDSPRDLALWGSLRRNDQNFRARVLRCNERMYPMHQIEYKKAYGLCIEPGCHDDCVPEQDRCESHPCVCFTCVASLENLHI